MAGGTLYMLHLGQNVVVVGLFTQLFFFGIFLTAAIIFYRRVKSKPTERSQKFLGKRRLDCKALIQALYAASVLILVRSVFRVIEYLDGNAGYIQRHEVFLYVFDGALMLSVMVIFNVIHPGNIISTVDSDTLNLKEWSGGISSQAKISQLV